MQSITELLQERSHKVRTLEDINAKRASEGDRVFTSVEKDEIAKLEQEIKELDTLIAEREDTDARAKKILDRVEDLKKPRSGSHVPRVTNSPLPPDMDGRRSHKAYKRNRLLRAFKGPDADEAAYECGMWLAGTLGNERAARWCANHGIEVRAMSEGVNTAGGVLVHDELSQRIIDLREQYGVFRQQAYIEPMGQDVKDISRKTDGTTAYFVGEGVTITESQSSWDNIKLVAKKLAVLTKVSSELDEDSVINLADDFAVDAARAFALKEDQCGFNGTGTSTYGGINGVCTQFITNIATWAGAYRLVPIDLFTEVTNDHLASVMGKLPGYVQNPKWYCSRLAWATVFQRLAMAAGGNTIQIMGEGPPLPSYMGYPIVISQVLQSVTTSLNDLVMLMFGDLSLACTMGDRRGITIARDTSTYFTTDQIALKATERVDIKAHNLGDATNAGAIVALLGDTA